MSQIVETVRICVNLPHKFIVINKSDLKPTDILYGEIESEVKGTITAQPGTTSGWVINETTTPQADDGVVTDASEERVKRKYTKKVKED